MMFYRLIYHVWIESQRFIMIGKSIKCFSFYGLISREHVNNLTNLLQERKKLICEYCKIKHGYCIQCDSKQCVTSFHVRCAQQYVLNHTSKFYSFEIRELFGIKLEWKKYSWRMIVSTHLFTVKNISSRRTFVLFLFWMIYVENIE